MNPSPKNTKKNPIKFAKETCMTQKFVTTTNMCYGIQITKSDLRSHRLGLYPIHIIFQTLFTFKPI
jgi:hypothetical protein